MINNKTATLLLVPISSDPQHFFVRINEEDGVVLESADYNFYPKQVNLVIAQYKREGYHIINKLPRTKVKFVEQPKEGTYGDWITEDGFQCYTNNRATALRWYKKYISQK